MLWNRLHLEIDLDMCVRRLSLWSLWCQDLLDLQVLTDPESAVAAHWLNGGSVMYLTVR